MAEVEFRAMGGRARLAVPDAHAGLLEVLVAAVADLESRWSRFLESSEVSQLGAADGRPRLVSEPTAALLDRARAAHVRTGGWFDPMMLSELCDAGYVRSFDGGIDGLGGAVAGRRGAGAATRVGRAADRPSLSDAEIDVVSGLVRLPAGSSFDPGGLGKGLAADRIAALARSAGSHWVIVDIGGDVHVAGQLPSGDFTVLVGDPFHPGDTLRTVRLSSGGVATSGTGRRRWMTADGSARHHLLDPRTGAPARTDIRSATVLATETWWAEAIATSLVVAGMDRARGLVTQLDVPALLVDEEANVVELGGIEEYFE